jgi:sulfur transfer complex TusBCD TusB component (DsrH family)
MPSLHIVSRSEALGACLEIAAEEDGILLIGAATSCAAGRIGRTVAVLADDLPGGLAPEPDAVLTDYAGFVDLVAAHQPVITWR